jgi:hypothetical protein
MYKYDEVSLLDMGEAEGDIAGLAFARAHRRLALYEQCQLYLSGLQKKYIKNKCKLV